MINKQAFPKWCGMVCVGLLALGCRSARNSFQFTSTAMVVVIDTAATEHKRPLPAKVNSELDSETSRQLPMEVEQRTSNGTRRTNLIKYVHQVKESGKQLSLASQRVRSHTKKHIAQDNGPGALEDLVRLASILLIIVGVGLLVGGFIGAGNPALVFSGIIILLLGIGLQIFLRTG